MAATRPNFLFLMVDEERYPPVYESPAEAAWRRQNLVVQECLRDHGVEFQRHYAGSAACAPSRTTLFTGQYPSLHGVSQTDGAAKSAFDADIVVPGTQDQFPSYISVTGIPDAQATRLYLAANRLNGYAFEGWVGPEPHGSSPRNSGSSAAVGLSGRDVVYADEAVRLLEQLGSETVEETREPWLLVCSLVNPHDIVLFGAITRQAPQFSFPVDESVPPVPPAPTAHESLLTKPRAQRSYRETYGEAFQPLPDTEYYRRLYLQLQHNSDQNLPRVFRALQESPSYQDTIVVFTSDHGDLQGSHGGLFQNSLTSHVDVLPTLLGLAGADVRETERILSRDHTEIRRFVGRDLSPLLLGLQSGMQCEGFREEPILFTTDDDAQYSGDRVPVPDQHELYHLSSDPIEAVNLADPRNRTAESAQVQREMMHLLAGQCAQKLLVPGTDRVPRTRDAARDSR